MSIFWRKHSELPDVELPQTIMRPFWHPEVVSLDDKQLSLTLADERPVLTALFVLIVSVLLLLASAYTLYVAYQAYLVEPIWQQKLITQVSVGYGFLLLSLVLFYIFLKIQSVRSLHFNRSKHTISYPQQGLWPRYHELSYDQFQGRIQHLKSLLGQRKACLQLMHMDNKHLINLIYTQDSPQSLAGYWSFIVQYMKKDAPLPDVPALHDYPNTTLGVIHQKSTDYS